MLSLNRETIKRGLLNAIPHVLKITANIIFVVYWRTTNTLPDRGGYNHKTIQTSDITKYKEQSHINVPFGDPRNSGHVSDAEAAWRLATRLK